MPDEPAVTGPEFDGHLERPLLSLSPEERLDWIWACMELLWAGENARSKLERGTTAEDAGVGSARASHPYPTIPNTPDST